MQLDVKSFKKFIKLTKNHEYIYIYIVREMRIFEKKVPNIQKNTINFQKNC